MSFKSQLLANTNLDGMRFKTTIGSNVTEEPVKKKSRKSSSSSGSTGDSGSGSTGDSGSGTTTTPLHILYIMLIILLRRKMAFSPSLLVNSFKRFSSNEAAVVIQMLLCVVSGDSSKLIDSSSGSSSDISGSDGSSSSKIYISTIIDRTRGVSWIETILDSHFASNAMILHSISNGSSGSDSSSITSRLVYNAITTASKLVTSELPPPYTTTTTTTTTPTTTTETALGVIKHILRSRTAPTATNNWERNRRQPPAVYQQELLSL